MRLCLKLCIVFAALTASIVTVAQTAPTTMNFQGRLTRLNGKPLPDGQYVVTIRLWKDLTSTNSNDLLITWTNLSVNVRSGVFSTTLPNLTEAVLAGGVAYLEIEPAGQSSLSPRIPLLSVPYAVLAGTVFDGAITTAKLAANSVTSANLSNDRFSIGKLTSNSIVQAENNKIGFHINDPSAYFQVAAINSNFPQTIARFSGGVGGNAKFLDVQCNGDAMNLYSEYGPLYLGASNSSSDPTRTLTILPNGYIGIGWVTPTNDIELRSNADIAIRLTRSIGEELNDVSLQVLQNTVNFGSYGNQSLRLGKIGSPGVTIANNGSVGLGLDSPSQKLDVAGSIKASSNVFAKTFTSTAVAFEDGIDLASSDAYANMRVIRNRSYSLDRDLYLQYQAGVGSKLHLFSDSQETMTIADNEVGIRTSSPQHALHVNGGFRVEDTTPEKPSGGSGETWSVTSDRRLKKNIAPLENALDVLLRLKGVTFDMIGDSSEKPLSGFIAQDVQAVKADWVTTAKSGYLQVGMGGFNAYVVEAFRDLQAQATSLRLENKALKARLDQQDRLNRMLINRLERLESKNR